MKSSQRIITASALFGAALLLFVLASGIRIAPAFGNFFAPADSTIKGPRIAVSELDHDFGKVEQHSDVETSVTISNIGTDTLHINEARPSCGCTVPVPQKNVLAPGESTPLKITFHPQGKAEGPFFKTINIFSNSVVESVKQIQIHGTVFISKLSHKEAMHITGVFEGDCASCHVNKGKGELSSKLYEADCAICHGSKADNKPGPDLTSDEMMNHTPDQWRKIIADGIVNSNMPAFHTKNKGPLGDDEIASLVDYLGAYKKNLAHEQSLKAPSSGGAAVKK